MMFHLYVDVSPLVVARSPDQAAAPTGGLHGSLGDLRSPTWHGRETVSQLVGRETVSQLVGRETVPQQGPN